MHFRKCVNLSLVQISEIVNQIFVQIINFVNSAHGSQQEVTCPRITLYTVIVTNERAAILLVFYTAQMGNLGKH